jgi:hypothetical protein
MQAAAADNGWCGVPSIKCADGCCRLLWRHSSQLLQQGDLVSATANTMSVLLATLSSQCMQNFDTTL